MDIYDFILNKKQENQFLTATVSSLSPLQVKLYPSDDAINVKSTTGLLGLDVGSNVILLKIGNQFVVTHVIGEVNFNYCILKKSNVQLIPTSELTAITYGVGTTIYDPLEMHSETTDTSKIVIKKAGYYNITIVGRLQDSSTSGKIFYLYKNGNAYNGFMAGHDGNGRFGGSFTTVLNLAVGDYLEFFVYQESGGDLDLITNNQFIVTPLLI